MDAMDAMDGMDVVEAAVSAACPKPKRRAPEIFLEGMRSWCQSRPAPRRLVRRLPDRLYIPTCPRIEMGFVLLP